MDEPARSRIATFVAQYQTLILATEHAGQPYATRIFFVEDLVTEAHFRVFATLIVTSRKLANLQRNPRVGIFIGPDQPLAWLEATARARILSDENEAERVRTRLAEKSSTAATFLSRVPTAAVELEIDWLRLTDLTGGVLSTEVTFGPTHRAKEA